jgi:hypothetical protein
MKTNLNLRGWERFYHCIAVMILAIGASSLSVSAVELLQNGSFNNGLQGWKKSPRFGAWSPLTNVSANAAISVNPPTTGHRGIVAYQNLNLTGVAGLDFTFSMAVQKNYAPAGKTVAVYLDYLTGTGQQIRTNLLRLDNSLASTSAYTNISTTLTLATNAAKVVRVGIFKENDGDFYVDNLSLAATGVTINPVPVVTNVFPQMGAYQSPITFTGSGFTSTQGMVFVGANVPDSFGGMLMGTGTVDSWANTQIMAHSQEPNRSGPLTVVVGGVEANGEFTYSITSSNFVVDAKESTLKAVKGQKIPLILRVLFLNGFTSTNGVGFFLPGFDQYVIPPTAPRLTRSGTYMAMLDTATLVPGNYSFNAQSLEDHSYARFTPIQLQVVTVTNINLSYGTNSVSSLTLSNQSSFFVQYDVQTSSGGTLTEDINITSSNPEVVLAFSNQMGYQFFAVGNGSATLTFTTPDGFSKTLPVTVNFTGPKYISSATSSPGVVHNGGGQTNYFFWQGVGAAPNGYGRSWSGFTAPPDYTTNDINWGTLQRTATVGIPAGVEPGSFLYYANISDSYTTFAERPFALQIVNASTHAMITGNLLSGVNSSMFMHDMSGDMVVYDNAGNVVKTNNIWTMNGKFQIAYLPPGTYRLLFVPNMGSIYAPQWFPSGTNFANASPITVSAGQVATNINFALLPPSTPPSDLRFKAPTFAQPTHLNFDVETKAGVTYVLEYKDSLQDATWKVAATITGDDQAQNLTDPAANPTQRMYRIRMLGD